MGPRCDGDNHMRESLLSADEKIEFLRNADALPRKRKEQFDLTPLTLMPGAYVSLENIAEVALCHRPVALSDQASELLQRGRAQLERKIAADEVIYGVNTGFGGNSDRIIPKTKLGLHQANLLTFLSTGTGPLLTAEYVRAAQLLMILALLRGWSAVRPAVLLSLVDHLNNGIVPQVPQHGSVGASGDLVPSGYIASAMCGIGEVHYAGRAMTAKAALALAGLRPLELEAKEGLALVNGTRVMTGIASITVLRFATTFRAALGALALAVEALLASRHHYDERIHLAKGHPGQIAVAQALRSIFARDGQNAESNRADNARRVTNPSPQVTLAEEGAQEIYSLRCAPQVLGVVVESLQQARLVLEREAVSANDNPLIDPDTGDVLHGGNFMGQHVARAMDGLKIDLTITANHLHAIMALLMDQRFSRGLPNSLSPNVGLSQGFKGVQLSQTALVAHLRHDSGPSCVHTLPTEQFNQDVVSLGLHAAMGAAEMEVKLRGVVAMTLLAAAQAIDLRGNAAELAPGTSALYRALRAVSPPLREDRRLDLEIAAVSDLIMDGSLPLPLLAPIAPRRSGAMDGLGEPSGL
jgi:histidine ammonia-lyase